VNDLLKRLIVMVLIALVGLPSAATAAEPAPLLPPLDAIKDPIQKLLYKSIKLSLDKDPDMKEIEDVVNGQLKKSNGCKKVPVETLVGFKGSLDSKDAANALMEADVSLKSLASAELKLEKKVDERYFEVLVLLTELAGVMGYDDYADRMDYKAAYQNLSQLVGDADAQQIVQQLVAIKANFIPPATPRQHAMSAMEFADQRKILIEATEQNDTVLQDLIAKVNQTAAESKTDKTIDQKLSVLSLVPGGIGTVAQLAQLGFDENSEDARLLYTLYLYKRVELRKRIIFASVANALHAFEVSMDTNNPFLAAFAVSTMIDLAGPEAAQQVASSPSPGWEPIPQRKDSKAQSATGK
jgi:hypothetical protein